MSDAFHTENTNSEPRPDAETDDLGLTHEEWQDLQFAYNYGTIEPEPGTVEDEAFRQMDQYARREIERVAAAEEADKAWRASRPSAAKAETDGGPRTPEPAADWEAEVPW